MILGFWTLIVLYKKITTTVMIKFVSILISVLSLNFMVSYTAAEGTQPEGIMVEFSKKAVGIESGQPVFTKDTKVLLSNPAEEKYTLYINENEKEIDKKRLEIGNLEKGTYTIMIVSNKKSEKDSKKTIGFTIQ